MYFIFIKKRKSSLESTLGVDSHLDTKSNQEKKHRSRQRRTRNDFYFLSFDNELSNSGSSSSEEDNQNTEIQIRNQKIKDLVNTSNYEDEDADEQNEDDEQSDMTTSMTSRSSSITVGNEDDRELINPESRKELINYLFLNQKNTEEFFNGNLTSFMTALDTFFSQNKIMLFNENQKDQKKKQKNDLDSVCDQILSLYNDFVTLKSKSIPSATEITHFPIYKENLDKNNTNSQSSIKTDCDFVTTSYPEEKTITDDNDNRTIPATTGAFLMAIFGQLDHMLSNPLQINFLLTGIIARMAYFPQLLLRSFLLNHNIDVQSNIQTLVQVIFK